MILSVGILTACSSGMDALPVLNGKKREPINTVIYDTPPLVVTSIPDAVSTKLVQPYIEERPQPRRVVVPTKPASSNIAPVSVQENSDATSTEVTTTNTSATLPAVEPVKITVGVEPAQAIPVIATPQQKVNEEIATKETPNTVPAARIFEPDVVALPKNPALPTEATTESSSSATTITESDTNRVTATEVVTLKSVKVSSSQDDKNEAAQDSAPVSQSDKKDTPSL